MAKQNDTVECILTNMTMKDSKPGPIGTKSEEEVEGDNPGTTDTPRSLPDLVSPPAAAASIVNSDVKKKKKRNRKNKKKKTAAAAVVAEDEAEAKAGNSKAVAVAEEETTWNSHNDDEENKKEEHDPPSLLISPEGTKCEEFLRNISNIVKDLESLAEEMPEAQSKGKAKSPAYLTPIATTPPEPKETLMELLPDLMGSTSEDSSASPQSAKNSSSVGATQHETIRARGTLAFVLCIAIGLFIVCQSYFAIIAADEEVREIAVLPFPTQVSLATKIGRACKDILSNGNIFTVVERLKLIK